MKKEMLPRSRGPEAFCIGMFYFCVIVKRRRWFSIYGVFGFDLFSVFPLFYIFQGGVHGDLADFP